MSEFPDDIMKAAQDLSLTGCDCNEDEAQICGYVRGCLCTLQEQAIARALLAERDRLRGEVSALKDHVEDLERDAEIVSLDFEGDCWRALKKLLHENHFDWSDVDGDGVTADEAIDYIRETINSLEADMNAFKERADTAHASGIREGLERAAKVAEGWPTIAGGTEYMTNGNGRYWDAGTPYDQSRADAAAAIRAMGE